MIIELNWNSATMRGLALQMHSRKYMTDSHLEYINNLINLYHKETKHSVFKENKGLEITQEALDEIRVSINGMEIHNSSEYKNQRLLFYYPSLGRFRIKYKCA